MWHFWFALAIGALLFFPFLWITFTLDDRLRNRKRPKPEGKPALREQVRVPGRVQVTEVPPPTLSSGQ